MRRPPLGAEGTGERETEQEGTGETEDGGREGAGGGEGGGVHRDHDGLGGLAALGADGLDCLDDLHALGDGTEDDVFTVEPVGLRSGGTRAAIRVTGYPASLGVVHVSRGRE
eukprot:SAG11_NODE_2558_length_3220_cov_11.157001_3_plen_112_part_00